MVGVMFDGFSQQLSGFCSVSSAIEQGMAAAVVVLAIVVVAGVCLLVALALRGSRPEDRVALLLAVAEVVRSLPLGTHHASRSHGHSSRRRRPSAPR